MNASRFDCVRPDRLEAAIAFLARHGGGASGQSLVGELGLGKQARLFA
jgi:hypothetical protein